MNGISTIGRATDQIAVARRADILSPGRLYTVTLVGKYHSDFRAWLDAKIAPIRGEIADLVRLGLVRDAGRLIERLQDFEWEQAERSKMGGLGVGYATGNLLLNEGWNADCWDLILGNAAQAFNNTNARTGVGDSATAASASQTDLQAATNKTYKGMVATYPLKVADRRADFRSDYVSGDANYAWQEFTIDNNEATPTNMLRVVSSQGTKASGQTWTLTVQVTLT